MTNRADVYNYIEALMIVGGFTPVVLGEVQDIRSNSETMQYRFDGIINFWNFTIQLEQQKSISRACDEQTWTIRFFYRVEECANENKTTVVAQMLDNLLNYIDSNANEDFGGNLSYWNFSDIDTITSEPFNNDRIRVGSFSIEGTSFRSL